jgi:hypothetical protein
LSDNPTQEELLEIQEHFGLPSPALVEKDWYVAGAELAGLRETRNPTLVRHVYDLHVIREHYDFADVAILAREIMIDDAKTYGRDFPAYEANPLAETLKAIDGIGADDAFANNYATFRRDMVYGRAPDFETAVATLQTLAEHLGKN